MKILVVENNSSKIKTFINTIGHHNLTVVDNENDAVDCLEQNDFDIIFLDNDLGDGGFGANVASYLFNNRSNANNESLIVLHSYKISDSIVISKLLSNTIIAPLDLHIFSYLGLDN